MIKNKIMKPSMKTLMLNHEEFMKEIDEVFACADAIMKKIKDSKTDIGKIEQEKPKLEIELSEPKHKEEDIVTEIKLKSKHSSKSLL